MIREPPIMMRVAFLISTILSSSPETGIGHERIGGNENITGK